MPEPARVELIRRSIPATAGTIAARQDVAERLDALGHIQSGDGSVAGRQTQWLARINDGSPFPVDGLALQTDDDGNLHVSLVFTAASVDTGRNPDLSAPAPFDRPATPPKNERKVWGAPGPDPRAGIVAGFNPTGGEGDRG